MRFSKKKIKKNLPYLFVFLAVAAIVAYRSYMEIRPKVTVEPVLTADQKAYVEHRIANIPYYHDLARIAEAPSSAFVDIGTIGTDNNGRPKIDAPATIPEDDADIRISPVITITNPPPTPAEIADAAKKLVAPWKHKGFRIEGVYIRYDIDKPDFLTLETTAKEIKRAVGSINIVLKRAWLEDTADGTNNVGNVGKYSRIFAFDAKEAIKPNEDLAAAVHELDNYKFSYFMIVDERPDLVALRQKIGQPASFMGVVYRNVDILNKKDQEDKK